MGRFLFKNYISKKKTGSFVGVRSGNNIGAACLAGFMFSLAIFGIFPVDVKSVAGQVGYGLDPKNDPVVYQTSSGIEIRKSDGKVSATKNVVTNSGTKSYTQDYRSFYYVTMGVFSGSFYKGTDTTTKYTVSNVPVNWLIIGKGADTGNVEYVESESDAGIAMLEDPKKAWRKFYGSLGDVPTHSDIPSGCVLVISECMLGRSHFNSNENYLEVVTAHGDTSFGWHMWKGNSYNCGNRYRYASVSTSNYAGTANWNAKTNGHLYNYINNLFTKNASGGIVANRLGFTAAQAAIVQPQKLRTYYDNGGSARYLDTYDTDGNTLYTMFPLAWRASYTAVSQNFCLEDYNVDNKLNYPCFIGTNVVYGYWLRSASYSSQYNHAVCASGGGSVMGQVGVLNGVRPAMVLKFSDLMI